MAQKVQFVETVLRDANQSLIATRLPFDKFEPMLSTIDKVGYYAIECWGGATFDVCLRYCIEDCAAAGKRLVVLDRPNPLGDRVEGGIVRPEVISFVGGYEIPVCYGLTCGELAEMMNRELHCGCDLHIIPCTGLTRSMTFRDWGHCWVMPSMGIPRFETALLYPGTCLIEGTNCSEGRGTGDPFGIIGAPFIQAEVFITLLTLWATGIPAYLQGRSVLAVFQVYLSQVYEYTGMILNTPSIWALFFPSYEHMRLYAMAAHSHS